MTQHLNSWLGDHLGVWVLMIMALGACVWLIRGSLTR